MGPRMFIRGNIRERGYVPAAFLAASMGPRMFIRGNKVAETRLTSSAGGFNGAADVHPRKRAATDGHPNTTVLQWGRGCSSAETLYRVAMLPRFAGLQWGRGCSSAETGVAPGILQVDAELQWGRGCSSAETAVGKSIVEDSLLLQWGRGCSSAETRASRRIAQRWKRFNGAADVHPRKQDVYDAFCRRALVASMGPRMFIRGNLPVQPSRWALPSALQWGRGCSSAETDN